ncbi:MAG: hypothetical protein ACE145_19595 [Terriglobia bacterium]
MIVDRRRFLSYCGLSPAMSMLAAEQAAATQEKTLSVSGVGEGNGDVPAFPGIKERIPFSLNGRSGNVTISYGRNGDPASAGFDIIPGLKLDIAVCRGYPAIHAVIDTYHGSGYRTFCGWLQVVTDMYYNSYDAAQAPVETAVFADMAPSMEDLGGPFTSFGNLPQFFDAPCKNLYGHAKLRWVADTFLTTVPMRSKAEEISRLLGFRWGYVEYDTPEQRPVSVLPLEVTDIQVWNGFLPFLRKKFPAWRFANAESAPSAKS